MGGSGLEKALSGEGIEAVPLGWEGAQAWSADLDHPADFPERMLRVLSAAERERAQKYRFERDRWRFVVRRALLRRILGWYLGIPPRDVPISIGAGGKPSLAGFGSTSERLCFNDSHSEGCALFGVSWGREIGVDLEKLRPIAEADDIVRRYFAEEEAESYAHLPEGQKPLAFLTAWTRKEAYLKATGQGLLQPLSDVVVPLDPRDPARLLSVCGKPGEALRWSIIQIRPREGFLGAVCVENP